MQSTQQKRPPAGLAPPSAFTYRCFPACLAGWLAAWLAGWSLLPLRPNKTNVLLQNDSMEHCVFSFPLCAEYCKVSAETGWICTCDLLGRASSLQRLCLHLFEYYSLSAQLCAQMAVFPHYRLWDCSKISVCFKFHRRSFSKKKKNRDIKSLIHRKQNTSKIDSVLDYDSAPHTHTHTK